MQQRSEEWFNARRGKLTASRFGVAAGICAFQSRDAALRELWEETPFEGNDATQHGTDNEPNAILAYSQLTGNIVTPTGFHIHPTLSWLGGSPDGLVGELGMIEAKCPFYKRTPHDKIPPHYLCQINGCLEMTGRKWCDFISWTATDTRVYRVHADPELFDFMTQTCYVPFYAHYTSRVPIGRTPGTHKQSVLDRLAQHETTHVDYKMYANVDGRLTPPSDPWLNSPPAGIASVKRDYGELEGC